MLENAGFAPIAVTHEHTVPLTELLRKVTPRAACSRDPQHSFNEQPVITPATTRITGFAQTMWFHLRPLGVRQNESIHQKLESYQASKGNPDSQQTLVDAPMPVAWSRRPVIGARDIRIGHALGRAAGCQTGRAGSRQLTMLREVFRVSNSRLDDNVQPEGPCGAAGKLIRFGFELVRCDDRREVAGSPTCRSCAQQ